ncbi:CoA transferase [Nocardioides pakistanensis]
MSGAQNGALSGLRVVEAASFVAGPSGGMALAQLGAEVIRVDPPGGGSDYRRWPVDPRGASLYWANLNKGKRSVTIDYRQPEGKELLLALATRPGPSAGIFLDNMVGRARPTYEELAQRRADIIHVHVQGASDGRPAVDYTVNAGVGIPDMTGPQNTGEPVNQVLPAWDLLTGMTAATAVLAALQRRHLTGEGSRIDLSLADVALSGVGSLGWLAEADQEGHGRPRHGNHVYGSFGVDFATADGRRVMVVALTEGQWHALCRVTETEAVFDALAATLDADLNAEADRYRLRETIAAILKPWFNQRTLREVSRELDAARVLWGPYRSMTEAAELARSDAGSVAVEIDQPGVGPMLASGSPLRWSGELTAPQPAPLLGADTEAVLAEVLGLTPAELGGLAARGVVGSGLRHER